MNNRAGRKGTMQRGLLPSYVRAEKCIALRPDWDKGYFRKGSVLEAQEAFTEVRAAAWHCVPT